MASVTLNIKSDNISLSEIKESALNAGFYSNVLSSDSIIVHSSDLNSLSIWSSHYENNEDILLTLNEVKITNRISCDKQNTREISLKPSTVPYFTMPQVRSIYNIPTPNPSTNVVVGVMSFGGGLYGNVDAQGVLTGGDVQAYWTSIGISTQNQPKVIIKTINGATNTPNINDGNLTMENTLDVETIGGACPSPNMTIILYISPNTLAAMYNILNYAINTPVVSNSVSYTPTIISISWGAPEIYFSATLITNIASLLSTATSNGINICTATGDYGSNNNVGGTGAYCDFPSSCPFVTAVGGTTLTSVNYIYDANTSEVAWSSGGGGISIKYSKPTYQTSVTASGRSIPDLAAVADPSTGVVFIINGQTYIIGGTSVSAPIIAGYLATIKPSNFINPILYTANSNCFQDVLIGSNGAYSANTGYDKCTGLGSINGTNLTPALVTRLVSSITISPTTLTINTDQTSQLTATVLPNNATNSTLSWSSSNTGVATVSNTGLVSGVAVGNTVITVSSTDGSNKTATCAVTVNQYGNIAVTGITLNTNQRTIILGQTYQLVATVIPANATNNTVLWSSNSANGIVSNSGLVTAQSAGSFTITARTQSGNFVATTNFTVIVPVSSVSISPSSYSLSRNQTTFLSPIVLPANANNKAVTYSSSNNSVATVNSSGRVSALNMGTATITIRTVDGGFTATATINVVIPVNSVSVNTRTVNLLNGQTFQAISTVSPTNATNKTVTWSSSNSNIATVSSSGLITGTGNGVAIITVTTNSGSRTATITVNVRTSVTGVSLNTNILNLSRNVTSQLVATITPASASNLSLSWSTSNRSIATVSNTGLVRASRVGTSVITVRTADGNFRATCNVIVNLS